MFAVGERVRNVSGDVGIDGASGIVVEIRQETAQDGSAYTLVGVRYDDEREPWWHLPEELVASL